MINKVKDIGLTLLVVLIVVIAGLAAVNQYLSFRYKVEFLGTPCQLCTKLNPNLTSCLEQRVQILPQQSNTINTNFSNFVIPTK